MRKALAKGLLVIIEASIEMLADPAPGTLSDV